MAFDIPKSLLSSTLRSVLSLSISASRIVMIQSRSGLPGASLNSPPQANAIRRDEGDYAGLDAPVGVKP
jgi:hypothetical protein